MWQEPEASKTDGGGFTDQERICSSCSQTYTWTAGEQLFFRDRDFTPPRRCRACRETKRAVYGSRRR
jgi:hypothetical protein